MTRIRGAIYAATAIALAACGQESPMQSEPAPVTQTAVAPSDPKLARLYDQTCRACHTSAGSGAPQAGDANAWKPRLAQGMPTLLDRTINGYKGMPPLGSCMDCNEAEFEALIRFMAGA